MADAASLEILAAPGLLKLLSDNLWQLSQSKIPGSTTRPVDTSRMSVAWLLNTMSVICQFFFGGTTEIQKEIIARSLGL
jgi:hypothetical protein